MSNFSASIPVAQMQAANDLLNNTAQTPGVKSFGPNNFSVAAFSGPSPAFALLHAWSNSEFQAAGVEADEFLSGVFWAKGQRT